MNADTRRLAEILFTKMFDASGLVRAASSMDGETQARHLEHVARLGKIAILTADAFKTLCAEFDGGRGETKRGRVVREFAVLSELAGEDRE